MEKNLSRRKTLTKIIIAVIAGLLLVLLMDIDQFIAAYRLYSGQAENFEVSGSNTSAEIQSAPMFNVIRLYSSRYLMTSLLVIFNFILIALFKDKQDYLSGKKFFEENPHMASIIKLGRWAVGIIIAVYILNFGRDFFNDTFHNCLIGRIQDFFRVFFAFFFLALCLIDFKKLFYGAKHFYISYPRIYTAIHLIVVSIICCCLLEFQVGSKMQFVSYMLFFNCLYWLLLQLFFLILIRRLRTASIISLLVAFAIGLANDIVYQFRGNYIMFGDLTVIRTALEVVGNYTYSPTLWLWFTLALFVITLLIVKKIKEPQIFAAKRNWLKTAIFEFILIAFIGISFKTGFLYNHVFGVHWDYNESVAYLGYIPYFLSNMDASRNITVDGYAAENVDGIIDEELSDYEEKDVTDLGGVSPNIIMIQNEAFSDLSITADIETDVDYMPFIHSLSENTQKGYLNMSVTGGPTSNTEFEVLSRASLQYFPYGAVVFTQYLKQPVPSLVEALKAQANPYYTLAYHCYYSTGYNRNSAYSYLGFDEKVFENNYLSDFAAEDLPRSLLSDEADYRKVIEMYEEHDDKPFFCFNVTMQNHGGYTGSSYQFEEPVKVTNFEASESLNNYLSLIKMSDSALKGLIEYFENVDEPTIIVMYGDHQPSFDDETKLLLSEHPAWEDEQLQAVSGYYVPYIIWANYDIDEVDNLNKNGLNKLSTNYLGTTTLKLAGLELSDYDKMLDKISEETPAITAIGVWDNDGNYYSNYALAPNADKLLDLDYVQYNMILDKNNQKWNRFVP